MYNRFILHFQPTMFNNQICQINRTSTKLPSWKERKRKKGLESTTWSCPVPGNDLTKVITTYPHLNQHSMFLLYQIYLSHRNGKNWVSSLWYTSTLNMVNLEWAADTTLMSIGLVSQSYTCMLQYGTSWELVDQSNC